GVDAEMVWTGTDDACGYGILDPAGEPTPLYHVKRLCAGHVRYGDSIRFPLRGNTRREWDAVVSEGPQGRKSVFVAHLADRPGKVSLADLDPDLADGCYVIKLEGATDGQPAALPCRAPALIEMEGLGAAVATNEMEPERIIGPA